jgi:hypothetical protein
MILDLTDEETAVLLRELDQIIDGDRYFLSPRIQILKAIRAKNPARAGTRAVAADKGVFSAAHRQTPEAPRLGSTLAPISPAKPSSEKPSQDQAR